MVNVDKQFECPLMRERALDWQVKCNCPWCGVPNKHDETICLSSRNPMRRVVVRKNLGRYRPCSGHGQEVLVDLLERLTSE